MNESNWGGGSMDTTRQTNIHINRGRPFGPGSSFPVTVNPHAQVYHIPSSATKAGSLKMDTKRQKAVRSCIFENIVVLNFCVLHHGSLPFYSSSSRDCAHLPGKFLVLIHGLVIRKTALI